MPTTFIGTTFPISSQWRSDELHLIESIKRQIDNQYPDNRNLFVNTTWFGPQFSNGQYENFLLLTKEHKFDNLFMLASVDPVFLSKAQIESVYSQTGASKLFLIGHFEGEYYFNFHSTIIPKYFEKYTDNQVTMTDPKYIFLNYNRKPRDHRTKFVKSLIAHGLGQYGMISLGKNQMPYSNDPSNDLHLVVDTTPNYSKRDNWNMDDSLGIAHDIHSLGDLDKWNQHFLHIVSETEFNPWDPLFISEKTWKPIIGLRPFVINGQTKIYKYLRDNGFKTFENYFNIQLEDIPDYMVHDSIIKVIETLIGQDLNKLYKYMQTDLMHNRTRFFEFAEEQKYKSDNLFT